MDSHIVRLVEEGAVILGTVWLAYILLDTKRTKDRLVQSSARLQKIWEQSFDGMRLIDDKGCIVAVNASFCAMFGMAEKDLIGKPYFAIYKEEFDPNRLAEFQQRIAERNIEHTVEREAVLWDGRSIVLGVTNSFIDIANEETCILSIFRDVTKQKHAEREREQLIRELETAAANIKTLGGLLPICSSCKKIRNDHGYWDRVELFIAQHTQATFTHGLCPDCLKSAYDELEVYKAKLAAEKKLQPPAEE